jgi:hypothetical protein
MAARFLLQNFANIYQIDPKVKQRTTPVRSLSIYWPSFEPKTSYLSNDSTSFHLFSVASSRLDSKIILYFAMLLLETYSALFRCVCLGEINVKKNIFINLKIGSATTVRKGNCWIERTSTFPFTAFLAFRFYFLIKRPSKINNRFLTNSAGSKKGRHQTVKERKTRRK